MGHHPTMKTSLSITRAALYFGIGALLMAAPGLLLADKTVQPEMVKPNANGSGYDLQIVEGKLLRGPGGTISVDATLANVVDALRERYTEANIVYSPGLAKIKIGDVRLRAGRLLDELQGLRVAADEKFNIETPNQPALQSVTIPQIDPKTGVAIPFQDNPGLVALREAPQPPQEQRMVEAFNIGPYLDWLNHRPASERKQTAEQEGLEEIEQVLHSTIADFKNGPEDQPKWQYHRGATLLVVIGKPEVVEIARKIVNALPGMNGVSQAASARDLAQQRAEDAFRARYGLQRRPATQGQPNPVPAEPATPQ